MHKRNVRYDAQLAKLDRWLPDEADRNAVLCDTPRELFAFGPPAPKPF